MAVRPRHFLRNDVPGRKDRVHLLIVVHRQRHLLQIVEALHPPGRFAGRLHRRQEQCHQHADDGNDHQQLHQREAEAARRSSHDRMTPQEGGKSGGREGTAQCSGLGAKNKFLTIYRIRRRRRSWRRSSFEKCCRTSLQIVGIERFVDLECAQVSQNLSCPTGQLQRYGSACGAKPGYMAKLRCRIEIGAHDRPSPKYPLQFRAKTGPRKCRGRQKMREIARDQGSKIKVQGSGSGFTRRVARHEIHESIRRGRAWMNTTRPHGRNQSGG